MSGFWSAWVIFFVVLNAGMVTFLMIYAIRVRIPTDKDGNTTHVWAHGTIREGLRPLPLWWVLMSVASIIFAIYYLVLYPGFGRFPGTLGWSSEQQVAEAIADNERQSAMLRELVATQSLDELAVNADVVRAGKVLFVDNCAACHGGEGKGNQIIGAPDLTDDDWLHGDSEEALRVSIVNGRNGVMPPLGAALGERGVRAVATYVYELNGRDWPGGEYMMREGREHFQALCVACHGQEGKGNPALGAPDLTDDIWLYGSKRADIMDAVNNGRSGQMPGWEGRLTDDQITLIMAWIRAAGKGSE